MPMRILMLALVLAPMLNAVGQEEDRPKVISTAIEPGQLVSTSKIGVTDGLFLSISFVVIDPSQPEARKLEQGLAGLAFIENHTPTRDYKLSQRTRVKLLRGGKQFTLVEPEVKDINDRVKALDFSSFVAADLLTFLKRDGKLSVEVDGKSYELSEYWNQHVADLVKEVEKQRQKIGHVR
jgi:hypothetical protein